MRVVTLACSLGLVLAVSKTWAQSGEEYWGVPPVAPVIVSDTPDQNVLTAAVLRAEPMRRQSTNASMQAQIESADAGVPIPTEFDQQPAAAVTTVAYEGSNRRSHYFRNRVGGPFYAQVDALFWVQDPDYGNQPLVVDAITGATLLDSSDLNSNFVPGLRATIGMQICGCKTLELSYLGLFPTDGSETTLISPGDDAFLIFPGNFFGNVFVGFDSVTVSSQTSLNGIEANFPPGPDCCIPCDCCGVAPRPSVDWFAGFRYLNLTDELNIDAERTENGAVETGNYNVRTTNNLYGVQLGARVRRNPRPFGWEATGKAGVFGNDARQTQTVTDFPDFPIRPTVSRSGGNVAFVGELNLTGLYRLNNHWVARAGYSALLIEGVALAPDQLDFNFAMDPSGDQLDTSGGVLYHGANLGLEASW